MADKEQEEREYTKVYLYSHMDCPYCDEEVQCEGDVKGETILCDVCGKFFETY